eukprot:TRINITY_DN3959_c0_g1_i1.p1 TRINITY_DN3959_c0_g1~~TRINITY_DN3959_c0_g1_i1.p1  ORF type:complete len:635 (+),score=127.13 TRINITY_DN3959_c0_g1_i1:62-1966(+)
MDLYKGQAYAKLKKHHLDLGVPWSDPTFPASNASIGDKIIREFARDIKWLRPKDIVNRPRFVVDSHSAKDVNQGKLGNCWFVAAAGTLAGSKPLWEKVVPDADEQEFSTSGEHPGVFRFRFYRFGVWTEVLVDDLLPTYNGTLLFSHSQENTEFWGALLEKAYAKLHGSYAVLQGGNLSDALVDFTSGVSEIIEMEADSRIQSNDEMQSELFKTMLTEIDEHSLMCCAIHPTTPDDLEKRTSMGLIIGHAYGITAVRKITVRGTGFMDLFKEKEKIFLVRLQNPWGEKEWNGPFSDTSQEWSSIGSKEREKMGLTVGEDGEFWMPYDDFLLHFSEMSICRVVNTSVFSFSKTWNEETFKGQWSGPNRCGGCLNNRATFLSNPQYKFDVYKNDDEVMIQISQTDQRSEGNSNKVVGFHIMKVEDNRRYRVHTIMTEETQTSDYTNSKHVFLRCKLSKGRYVIFPTTFNPGDSGRFLLRIFTDDDSKASELEEDFPVIPWWKCCSSPPILATRIKVSKAEGISRGMDAFGGKADPYCLIKCERTSFQTRIIDDDLSPVWNQSAIFYRSKPEEPIKLQIWNHNLIKDGFMGQAILSSVKPEKMTRFLTLVGRKSEKTSEVPGKILIELETSDDLEKI